MSEADTAPTPTRTRTKKPKRVVNRAPSVYLVEREVQIGPADGSIPESETMGWAKVPHGAEVKDTKTGEAWIRLNGKLDTKYRVVRVCSEKTRREKTVAVLE